MNNHYNLLFGLIIICIATLSGYSNELGDLENVIEYKKAKGELFDRFYPLGFSKKGYFCFIRIPADEALGCFLWEFTIFDLKRDKTEYNIGYKFEECDRIKNINSLLKEYNILFRNKMLSFKIKMKSSRILNFPLKIDDDIITADLKRIKKIKGKDGFFKTVYFLVINSKKRGYKIAGKIFEKSSKNIAFVYNSRINGYINSPQERLVVVVVEQELRGWEGPPNVSTFKIFGASLGIGFNKRDN